MTLTLFSSHSPVAIVPPMGEHRRCAHRQRTTTMRALRAPAGSSPLMPVVTGLLLAAAQELAKKKQKGAAPVKSYKDKMAMFGL